MRQNLLQNALGQFITKCGSLLQNAALLHNEMKKLLHFGRLLQNAPLLQNAAQPPPPPAQLPVLTDPTVFQSQYEGH